MPERDRSAWPTAADAEAIRAIYNLEVLTATSTFDLVPRTLDDQEAWLAARGPGRSRPSSPSTATATVVGFASLSPYKERAAYRTTVEDSVYVAATATARASARLLLDAAASTSPGRPASTP